MNKYEPTQFPLNWDEERVQSVIMHYESQTEEEAMVEDEMILADEAQTIMEIPTELVPLVRELIAEYSRRDKAA